MKTLFRVLRVLLLVAQVVVAGILVFSLVRMNILGSRWIVLIIAGLVGVFTLCALGLLLAYRAEKKKARIDGENGAPKVKTGIIITRVACGVLSIASIAGCVFLYQYTESINHLFDKISVVASEGEEKEEAGEFEKPFIVYISGSDSRENVEDPTARSDVNIVVVVNPKKGKILLASVPRDTYVQLHGTEGLKDKLTHAGLRMYYDADMSKLTMEDFLGIKIDYTVKVSFDTVVSVVDELGGVEIFSDTALNLKVEKKNKTCHIIYGLQTVDGDCALRFSRERKSYYRGDKHRGENQQEVLTGIINKLSSSRDYVLKLPTILEIAADSFETSFSRDEITTLIRKQLESPIAWQVESVSVDGEGQLLPTYTYPEMELYVMIADEESLAGVKSRINEYLETDEN